MQADRTDNPAVALAVSAVLIMVIWIVITAIVYGGFLLVWPANPEVELWVHGGVFAFPFVGYLAHLAAWINSV